MPPITTFGFRLRDLQGDGEIAYMRASRTQAREMRGERGGAEAGVAEVILNEREGDAGFAEMRGVAVPERMHIGALVHAALFDRACERALQRGPDDGGRVGTRCGRAWTADARRGKEPEWLAVRAPVRAQERERGVGERDVAILAALALMNVQQCAVPIHVAHMQANAFHQAESAGVDGGEARTIRRAPHRVEDAPHFVAAQHDGEFLRPFGTRDVEHPPRLAERLLIEELDPAEGDGVRAACDLLHGAQVQQVLADLFFPEPVRRGMMERRELGNGADVGFDRAVGIPAELEVLRHALAERCHVILSEQGARGSDSAPRPCSIELN